MYSLKTLTINSYLDEPVPHTFFKMKADTDHLAILFPGLRYTADMPLLYYSAHLMQAMGADVLSANYTYGGRADFETLESEEQLEWILADAVAVYQAGMAQRPYRQVTLIGKSLGTLSLGYLLTTQTLPLHVRAIWLTPLIQSERLRRQIQQGRQPSLFVIGTADPYYNASYLAEIQAATGSEIMTIEGADHSLNIENNVLQSIQALERVMRAIETFLAGKGKAKK